jgi:hypothetical protein
MTLNEKELNAVLASALKDAKTNQITWGQIRTKVYQQVGQLARKYYQIGITDSEGMHTIALFFALNYQVDMYEFMRYLA